MKAALPALAPLLLGTLALAACVPATKPPPAPAVAPSPRPVTAPTTPPPAPLPAGPAGTSWMDAPATPGNWEFAAFPSGTQALFRAPARSDALFAILCSFADRRIMLLRPLASAAPRTMRVLAETASRAEVAQPVAGPLPGIALRLDPRDPLLDAVALSQGRFAIETDALPTLYLPSWAEVSRVIEDCR